MLGVTLTQRIKQLPEYKAADQWPCRNDPTLSNSAVSIIEESFESAFIWVPGEWTFKLSGSLNGKPTESFFVVELSKEEVAGMKAVLELYEECQGVNTAAMFVSSGAAQTLVDKPRRDLTAPTAVEN